MKLKSGYQAVKTLEYSSFKNMIKAIIFDLGGVLIENPAPGMVSYFAASLGVDEKLLYDIFARFIKEFQKGIISEDTLWEKVCCDLRIQKPNNPSLWEEAFRNEYSPREEMFSLAAQLKERGFKIGLLSNSEVPAMKYFHEKQYDMFDVAVFSCAEGTMKPERRIYEIALKRLGVLPNEAVFIDDRGDFIDAAAEVGINTILFTSSKQVQRDLAFFSVDIK